MDVRNYIEMKASVAIIYQQLLFVEMHTPGEPGLPTTPRSPRAPCCPLGPRIEANINIILCSHICCVPCNPLSPCLPRIPLGPGLPDGPSRPSRPVS